MAIMYLSLHTVMQYWDLYDCMDNFDLMVLNVLETTLTSATYVALIILQSNKRLESVVIGMKGYIADVSLLGDEEKLLYHGHNNVAYLFGKYAIIATSTTAYLMYVRPLIKVLRDHQGHANSTLSYELPFRAHIIFDYTTDARIYSLLYLYQFPVTCVAVYHATEASFIVNLVLHFCGRLSVLSHRIRNISTESHRAFNDGIQKAVVMHLELVQSVQGLNDTLSVILLLELLGCCSRLGLAMFVVLIKVGTDLAAAINFSLYSFVQVGWLFLYCYIGEQAIFESQKVGDAFYEIDWPAVGNNDRKSLLICILNGYKTLYLTAGKVYTFSLFGFTSIIKTSMGCLSMLQASM
ncbi:odorant receptor 43a-like [Andrena cerasifolii]|uniref:odorant receptor 43a-like n=1 Tax=Andrena cerasifolii TaxID=2819439 RepID=UPI00403766B7